MACNANTKMQAASFVNMFF